jgi:hypothetical protein
MATRQKKSQPKKSAAKRTPAAAEQTAEEVFGKSNKPVPEENVDEPLESSTGPSLEPAERNPDFGKPEISTVDELLQMLEADVEPVDETEFVKYEWEDEEYTYPLRKKWKFRADKTYYRLQLISKPDRLDPATNQILKGKNLAAQFKNGRYDTRKEEVAKLIFRSRAFQMGRIEDIDEVNAKAKEQNYQALKATLSTAAEKKRLLRELIEELRSEAVEAK